MNQTINFKKECTLKTYANKIENITVVPKYKIDDDVIDGYFLVNGEYIPIESPMLNEEFEFKIPFQIALSNEIKKESIDLKLTDVDYILNKDKINLNILIDLYYQKSVNEEQIEINEEPAVEEPTIEEKPTIEEEPKKENDEEETTLKVYIVKKEDTLESIAIRYNISIDELKEYNENLVIEENSKIVVPIKTDD